MRADAFREFMFRLLQAIPINYLVLALALMLGACGAPPYDEQTDRLISALQYDVDSQLVALLSLDHQIAEYSSANTDAGRKALAETKARAGYDANAPFYDKLDSQLTSLRLRIDALPNEATSDLDRSIDELRANLLTGEGSLRSVHQQRGVLSEAYLRNERRILNTQFQALLSYELVLKAGSSIGKK
jgi:hypothetical protein